MAPDSGNPSTGALDPAEVGTALLGHLTHPVPAHLSANLLQVEPDTLASIRQLLQDALSMLKYETNSNLPEGQLRAQVKETLGQLEAFMKTLECEL